MEKVNIGNDFSKYHLETVVIFLLKFTCICHLDAAHSSLAFDEKLNYLLIHTVLIVVMHLIIHTTSIYIQ